MKETKSILIEAKNAARFGLFIQFLLYFHQLLWQFLKLFQHLTKIIRFFTDTFPLPRLVFLQSVW